MANSPQLENSFLQFRHDYLVGLQDPFGYCNPFQEMGHGAAEREQTILSAKDHLI